MTDVLMWLSQNWEYILIVFFVAEKIVKVTPTKYDDIAVDVIWSGLTKLIKTRKSPQ